MNKVIIMGRLGKDPDVRVSNGGTVVANFDIAVPRRFKRDGDPESDWFRCTAFGKTAEFCQKHLKKGTKVVVDGEVQNDNYEKNGVKHYGTRILVNTIEFTESKNTAAPAAAEPATDDGFMSIPEGLQEELPFI